MRHIQIGQSRIELLPRAPYRATYTPDSAINGFSFESQSGVHAFASDRITGYRARPNGLAYVPAGCDVYSESPIGGEYLKITNSIAASTHKGGERRFSDVIERTAFDAAYRLRRELLGSGKLNTLECEHHLMILDASVKRIFGKSDARQQSGRWMTTKRLKMIDEIIDASLRTKLMVAELAGSLNLSSGFFSQAFRDAIGRSPTDYILDRRLSRARDLVQNASGNLSDVACACGFSSHSHMTALFVKHFGIPPNQFGNR